MGSDPNLKSLTHACKNAVLRLCCIPSSQQRGSERFNLVAHLTDHPYLIHRLFRLPDINKVFAVQPSSPVLVLMWIFHVTGILGQHVLPTTTHDHLNQMHRLKKDFLLGTLCEKWQDATRASCCHLPNHKYVEPIEIIWIVASSQFRPTELCWNGMNLYEFQNWRGLSRFSSGQGVIVFASHSMSHPVNSGTNHAKENECLLS